MTICRELKTYIAYYRKKFWHISDTEKGIFMREHGVRCDTWDIIYKRKAMPRGTLYRWLEIGRAKYITQKMWHEAGWRRGMVNSWLRRNKYMRLTYRYDPPYQPHTMAKYLNTIGEFADGDIRLHVLPADDYKELIGLPYKRFQQLRNNPAMIPTRKELLHLAGWFRCGIVDLARPGNTNLQQALVALDNAKRSTIVGRAISQPSPSTLPQIQQIYVK